MAPAKSRDPAKALRAAEDPSRPGQKCRAPPGEFIPVIDRAACEGKADCVAVCPYDVFEVKPMADEEFNRLGFFGKLSANLHGRKKADAPRANRCQACGLCVVACPEEAIRLVRALTPAG